MKPQTPWRLRPVLRRLAGTEPEGERRRISPLGGNLATLVVFLLAVGAALTWGLLGHHLGILLAAAALTSLAFALSRRREGALAEEVRRRKQAEQEARAAAVAKGQFLANVSHEMRTPMHGVLGMADLLLRSELTAVQREQVRLIQTSAEALLALVNDVLDFSRIEAGRLVLRPREFGLREQVREVVRLLAPQAAEQSIDLRFVVAAEVPDGLHGDPVRLRQVLLNLVGNAVHFTRQGHVAIQVEAAGGEGAEPAVRFEVRDTGAGIRREVQALLFQPYAQSGGSGSRDLGGTGLGLVISKGIVEQMGGRIGFESTHGVGSTFWFEVPLVLARAAPPAPATASRPGPETPRRRHRVLVVDDHPVNRSVALAQLATLGYPADAAAGGEAALAALAKEPYDAVLLDCEMPQLDGYETCRRLREHEGEGRHTVVIAVTAHALAEDQERCRDAGMDDFLAKPFQGAALAAVLDRWLEGATAAAPAPAAPPAPAPEGLEERLAALDRLGKETGEEMRRQVVEAFLNQGSVDLEAMRQALAREDGAALAAAAHSLAGGSGILGAGGLAAGCAELEALARQGDLAACAPCLGAVEQIYRAFAGRLSA